MAKLDVEVPDDVIAFLEHIGHTLSDTVLEMIVMDLYRRGEISGGKGTQLLGWSREKFIIESGKQGIPFTRITPEELAAEVEHLTSQCPQPSSPTPVSSSHS